jgi:hypothetical protein
MREKDLEWTKNMGLMAGGTLLKIPLVTYAPGHAYVALILSRQVQLLVASRGGSGNMQLTFAAAVWVVWGLAVLSSGIRNDAIYERLVGLALMTVTAVLYFQAIKDESSPMALIAVVIGGAFWVVGILRGTPQQGR